MMTTKTTIIGLKLQQSIIKSITNMITNTRENNNTHECEYK